MIQAYGLETAFSDVSNENVQSSNLSLSLHKDIIQKNKK